MTTGLLTAQRWCLYGAVVLSAVVFWTGSRDPLNVPQLTAGLLLTLAAVTLGLVRSVQSGSIGIPRGPALWVPAAFAAALIAATVTAADTSTAVVGTYGRNSGLMLYATCLAAYFVVLAAFSDEGALRSLIKAVLAAGVFIASYGALQRLGIDAVGWERTFNPIIATLGNPNFASAYLGIVVPLATWGAVTRTWPVPWRAASGALAAMCLILAVLSGSAQGPIAAAAGVLVFTLAWLFDQPATRRQQGVIAVGGIVGLGVTLIGAGLAGIGPAADAIGSTGTLQTRRWFWQAAVDMTQDNPLLGIGLDNYGSFFRAFSPVAAADAGITTNAAHSVPLSMFAGGGLVLGFVYLAVLGLGGLALVVGLRRRAGESRLLVGALGGAWLAYVVQSLVSMDKPPLAILHWVLLGALVAHGLAPRRSTLGRRIASAPVRGNAGSSGTRSGAARSGAARRAPAVRRPTWATPASVGIVVLALVGSWVALRPLRADIAAETSAQSLLNGNGTTALERSAAAVDRAPWEGLYWLERARVLDLARQPDRALEAFRRAASSSPRDFGVLLEVARKHAVAGRTDEAADYFRRVVQSAGNDVTGTVAAADFWVSSGRAPEAIALLEEKVAVLDGRAELWRSLGEARAAAGLMAEARSALTRALELDPTLATAKAALDKLGPA